MSVSMSGLHRAGSCPSIWRTYSTIPSGRPRFGTCSAWRPTGNSRVGLSTSTGQPAISMTLCWPVSGRDGRSWPSMSGACRGLSSHVRFRMARGRGISDAAPCSCSPRGGANAGFARWNRDLVLTVRAGTNPICSISSATGVCRSSVTVMNAECAPTNATVRRWFGCCEVGMPRSSMPNFGYVCTTAVCFAYAAGGCRRLSGAAPRSCLQARP